MERDFAGSRVGRAEFQRLAALCAGDPKFPATFDDWLRLVHEGERQVIGEGKSVVSFDVNPADFEAWCRRVSVHMCFDALRAYLILTRRALMPTQGQQLSGGSSGAPGAGQAKMKGAPNDKRSGPSAKLARVLRFGHAAPGGLAPA
jgi:hypothetical protein